MGNNGSAPRRAWTFRVSRHFISRRDLSAMAKIVGIAVLCYADKTGQCCPTITQLAADLDRDEQTIAKFLDELKAVGALTWAPWTDELGHRRRNYYLATSTGQSSERLFIPPSDWDGLGGKAKDGRRTLQNPD